MIGRVVDTGVFSNQWQRGYSVAKYEREKYRFTAHSRRFFCTIGNG